MQKATNAQFKVMQENINRNHHQFVEMFLCWYVPDLQTDWIVIDFREREINNIARIQNSKVSSPFEQLEPLRDVNNRPIHGFPRDLREITQLDGRYTTFSLVVMGY